MAERNCFPNCSQTKFAAIIIFTLVLFMESFLAIVRTTEFSPRLSDCFFDGPFVFRPQRRDKQYSPEGVVS